MQISSETVFNPAMGVGLSAGQLYGGSETTPGHRQHYADRPARTRHTAPCRHADRRLQDCAYIFQCA